MWAPWETGLCHLSFYLWKCPMQFFASGVQGIRMSRGPFQEPFLPQRTARLCSSVTKEEEWLWKLSVPITFSISERPQSSFPGWDPISPQSKAIFFFTHPCSSEQMSWQWQARLGVCLPCHVQVPLLPDTRVRGMQLMSSLCQPWASGKDVLYEKEEACDIYMALTWFQALS